MEDRTKIASMAMQGILANSEALRTSQERDTSGEYSLQDASEKYVNGVALSAVYFADALIDALNKSVVI